MKVAEKLVVHIFSKGEDVDADKIAYNAKRSTDNYCGIDCKERMRWDIFRDTVESKRTNQFVRDHDFFSKVLMKILMITQGRRVMY